MRPETRQSFVLVAGTGVTTALGLAYTVYAGRKLGEADMGDFVNALSVVALVQISLGPINATVARFTAQYALDESLGKVRMLCHEVMRRVAWWSLPACLIGLAAVNPLADWWNYQSAWSLVVALLMIYLTLLLAVCRGALRGLQAFGQMNINTVSEAAIRLMAGLGLLAMCDTAVAGLGAIAFALLATLALSKVQLARALGGHERQSIDGRAVRQYVGPMLVMMITTAGFRNVDMLMVKHYLPDADAGAYGVVFLLARSMTVIVTPFNTLMLPMMTNATDGRSARIGAFVRVCLYYLALAAIPLVVFAVYPREMLGWLFAGRYVAGAAVLFPLALGRVCGHLCQLVGLALAARNDFRFLSVYVGGFVAQFVGVLAWHDRMLSVAVVTLVCQAATLMLMGLTMFVRHRE